MFPESILLAKLAVGVPFHHIPPRICCSSVLTHYIYRHENKGGVTEINTPSAFIQIIDADFTTGSLK
jgi:hypothetical protein